MLQLCTQCRRRVRAEDAACPFCGGQQRLRRAEPDATFLRLEGRRLDRLSLMTFTSVAASLAACAAGPGANTGGTTTEPSAATSTSAGPAPSTTASSSATPTGTASAAPSETPPGPLVNAPMYGAPPPFNAPGPAIGAYGAPSPGLAKGPSSQLQLSKAPAGDVDLRHLRARLAGMRACHQQVLGTDPSHKATCKLTVTLGGGGAAKATVVCTPASPTLEPCLKKRLETGTPDDGPVHTYEATIAVSPQK